MFWDCYQWTVGIIKSKKERTITEGDSGRDQEGQEHGGTILSMAQWSKKNGERFASFCILSLPSAVVQLRHRSGLFICISILFLDFFSGFRHFFRVIDCKLRLFTPRSSYGAKEMTPKSQLCACSFQDSLWQKNYALEQIRKFPDTIGYVWTAENDSNTLVVDAKIVVSAKKYLPKKIFRIRADMALKIIGVFRRLYSIFVIWGERALE